MPRNTNRVAMLMATAIVFVALTGCGGAGRADMGPLSVEWSGSGGGGGPTEATVTLHSNPAFERAVLSDGVVASVNLGVGHIGYRQVRSFVRFDLTQIPAGATVQSATLEVYQTVSSGSPYARLGRLMADSVRLGSSVDFADFWPDPAYGYGVPVNEPETNEGRRTFDVGDLVIRNVEDGQPNADFRFRFEASLMTGEDLIYLHTNDLNNPHRRPRLFVTYIR